MREVADDRFDLRRLQGSALDLGANGIEAFRGGCGTYRDEAARRLGKAPERRFGKADFVGADQGIVIRDQQRCQQDFRVRAAVRPG